MKHLKIIAFVIAGVLLGGLFFLWNGSHKVSTTSVVQKDSAVCPQEYSPVCGVDGKTYSNSCVATQQNGIGIATQGECPPQSSMSEGERASLFWLLRERQAQGLPDVRIRHFATLQGDCADCYSYYYAWNDPMVIARIRYASGIRTEARDTLGYEYLKKKQGDPMVFSELPK